MVSILLKVKKASLRDRSDISPQAKQPLKRARLEMGDPQSTKPITELHHEEENVQELRATISRLEREKASLEALVANSHAPTWQTLYRVSCDRQNGVKTYSDVPELCASEEGVHLQGRHCAENVWSLIPMQKQRVSFIVFQDYRCCIHGSANAQYKENLEKERQVNSETSISRARITGEKFYVTSNTLRDAFEMVTAAVSGFDRHCFPSFHVGKFITAPYFWYFHNRTAFELAAAEMRQECREEFKLFQEYISRNFGKEYRDVDSMFSNGNITARFFEYLYKPGSVILVNEFGAMRAVVQSGWPKSTESNFWMEDEKYYVAEYKLSVKSWHWSFNGVFQRTEEVLTLPFVSESSKGRTFDLDEVIGIRSLNCYPLKYALPSTQHLLRERGMKFWSCRRRNYVTYSGGDYNCDEMSVRCQ